MVKNPPANARDVRGAGLIPGPGRSPGGEHGNPLQYSCLENPMDRRALWLQSMGSHRVRLGKQGAGGSSVNNSDTSSGPFSTTSLGSWLGTGMPESRHVGNCLQF